MNKSNFSRITWINALIGLILFAWQQYNGEIPAKIQLMYFAIMIGATGIPHGALDHIIAKTSAISSGQSFSIQQFLGKYVLAILLYSASWIFFPGISLIIFLLISAWHFGETDLSNAVDTRAWNLSRMLWGSLVLMIILLSHFEETASVVLRITQGSEIAQTTMEHLKRNGIYYFSGVVCLFFSIAAIAYKKNKISISYPYIINLFAILMLCSQLPLLPAFALYFGGWHAIKSFEIIFRYLHDAKEEMATKPLTLWKNALPMTFLAAFGFIFMAFIWNGTGMKMDPLPAVFIFLSIITLPHLDVMDKLINRQSKG
ncbi:MAG: Brp/Blh family beta-carotene 15,15'-dioxygenase [bacterium]|jgi:Brp/Blh family beta-carotene 15,15'-monooxygenase|nr:Brp/Blh family beta-carotene 15,15'-dioxygenase [Chitinophagaceae bacterium]